MNETNLNFVIDKINKLQSSISDSFYQHYMNRTYNDERYEEYPGYADHWITESVLKLYYLILTYFELKSLPLCHQNFKERFEVTIKKEEDILIEEQYHPEDEMELKILHDFMTHLNPHADFEMDVKYDRDLSKVHSIVGNSNHILKKLNIQIKNEADIYNPIKWILGLYYPKTRSKNKASFIQQFKTYHPDILIPELKTAIEYKYIKTDNENLIDDYIDQIKVDSINYTGDSRFDNFIAVIFLKNSVLTTSEKIFESWKSKSFPKNWKLIISNS